MFERTEHYVIVRGDRYDHQSHIYGTNQYDCPACCALRSISAPNTEGEGT